MRLDSPKIIMWLVCMPFFTLTFPRLAILDIYVQGKSRTFLKKHKHDIPFVKKFLLIGYISHCKQYIGHAKVFAYYFLFGFALEVLCLLFWLISVPLPSVQLVLAYFVKIKAYLYDIPMFLIFMITTKLGKDKKVTWRWLE